jgi:hypothetical protein
VPGKDVHIPIQTGDPVKSVANITDFPANLPKKNTAYSKKNHVGVPVLMSLV